MDQVGVRSDRVAVRVVDRAPPAIDRVGGGAAAESCRGDGPETVTRTHRVRRDSCVRERRRGRRGGRGGRVRCGCRSRWPEHHAGTWRRDGCGDRWRRRRRAVEYRRRTGRRRRGERRRRGRGRGRRRGRALDEPRAHVVIAPGCVWHRHRGGSGQCGQERRRHSAGGGGQESIREGDEPGGGTGPAQQLGRQREPEQPRHPPLRPPRPRARSRCAVPGPGVPSVAA